MLSVPACSFGFDEFCFSRLFLRAFAQDPLAILDSNEVSASDLQAIKAQLRQPLSRNLHTEPNDAAYVTHENTSKEFLQTVRMMHESFTSAGMLNKADSPLLEYATMSGAGKTRWGFQVARLLREDENFKKCVILRVGLNFNVVLVAATLIAPKQLIFFRLTAFPLSKLWPVCFLRGDF